MTNFNLPVPDNEYDNTRLQNYLFCRRYFLYSDVLNIVPHNMGIHIDFGRAGHEAIYKFLVHIGTGHLVETSALEGIKKLESLCLELTESEDKNYTIGKTLLMEFFSKYGPKIGKSLITLQAETEIREPLDDEIMYFGTPDWVTSEPSTETKTLWDWKFGGRKMADMESRMQSIDTQFQGYQWLTKADKVKVMFFYCVKNGPRRIQIPCYYNEEKIEIWRRSTLILAHEIYDKIKMYKEGLESPLVLFPNRGPKCISLKCCYMPICELNQLDFKGFRDLFKRRGDK